MLASPQKTLTILVPKDQAVVAAIGTGIENATEPKIIVKIPSGATIGSYPLDSGIVNGTNYWAVQIPADSIPRGEYIFTVSITTPEKIYEKDFGVIMPNDIGKVLPEGSLGAVDMLVLRW